MRSGAGGIHPSALGRGLREHRPVSPELPQAICCRNAEAEGTVDMNWCRVDERHRVRALDAMAAHDQQPPMTDMELRYAIATANGEERADLIAEAVRRVRSYPRAWLPEDARGLRA